MVGALLACRHGEKVLKLCPGLKDRLKLVAFRPAGYDTKNGKMDFIDSTRAADFIVSSTAGLGYVNPKIIGVYDTLLLLEPALHLNVIVAIVHVRGAYLNYALPTVVPLFYRVVSSNNPHAVYLGDENAQV